MSDERLEQLDYYTLLGVPQDASSDAIKVAFRAFARRYHPDRFAGGPPEKVERATRIYRRGSEAVQTLTDLEARRAYDAGLAKGELRLRDDPKLAAARAAAPRKDAQKSEEHAVPIRSPKARAYFQRAQEAARSGDLRGAWNALRSAIEQEPGNRLLEEALRKVEAQFRK